MILLSWDGTRPDYLEREADTPGLDRIRRQGVRAERLTPVFPSSTFPNHVSLATGTHPDRHGIVGNTFRDRKRGPFRYSNDASWIEAEPIWVAAERQGVRSATLFWVGSETDWNGLGATYRWAPFDGSVSEDRKVVQILEWLDLPEAERPRLILSWWHGCDSVGHRWGPDHARIATQLEDQDRALTALLVGLDAREAWDHATLLLVSDHGMAAVNDGIDLGSVLEEGRVSASVYGSGGFAQVFLTRREETDRALGLLSAIAGVRAVQGERMPPELRARHPRRTGDIVVFVDPPRGFASPSLSDRLFIVGVRALGGTPGLHGYDPGRPEMGALFLAIGRGVPAGARIGPQHVIDVAPTVARLLGIDPPRGSEGEPIPEIRP